MSGGSEALITDRMPFVHWLQSKHNPGDEFYPLAHLVLSGGPDQVWAGRFDLSPHMVYSDVQLYYAGGRSKITAEHLELAGRAREVYYDTAPTVAAAIHHRRTRSDGVNASLGDGSHTVNAVMTAPFADEGLESPDEPAKAIPKVTDFAGNDIELRARDMPRIELASRCGHTLDSGRRCTRTTPPGQELCTRHGGRIYTDVELRNIHRITKEKLLAAGETAVDNLIELLDSTNDMVRLKAAEAILDRTGFTPGVEVTLVNTAGDARSSAEIISERLARLSGSVEITRIPPDSDDDAVDAVLAEDDNEALDENEQAETAPDSDEDEQNESDERNEPEPTVKPRYGRSATAFPTKQDG